ncbi:uncharacterized protein LDX57_001853 [Aspergillus melleus]|uniref:uncharacterized protein n=1 Tax=Aspergillus melleus TaxID=138277 RepID=UPI001E8CD8A8|nr:uncharacterized protein LDX57_001853 [Aspergillus melleus]KAH8424096.1 hypothetical protein LDX57_001853 [Aspergillus melleus]
MSRWALLIGVNFYPTQPLKGCVNDIKLIQRYAESNVPSSQISALTATTPEQPGSKGLTGDPAKWPTLSNIREHLTKILSMSEPGDQVLIHYSGHGDRMLSPKNPSPHIVADHHVALVVLNEDATDTADLQGIVLAGYINRMVEKGLLVSLVLDCCFSGAFYRENCEPNSAVRTLIKASGQGEPTTSTGQRGKTSNIFRDAHTLPSWIVDPDGYMVIAACGPHELARERQFDGKWHGVLSYYLHETLKFMEGQDGSISYHTFLNNLVTNN